MLPILTGNVGIHGGNTGARESAYSIPFVRMPTLKKSCESKHSNVFYGQMQLFVAQK